MEAQKPSYEDLSKRLESLHHQMLDGAEKEYLLDRKCNELRAVIKSMEEEIKELRDGIELYTEPWIQVGTERTGPVLGTKYVEGEGRCEDKWIPEGIELGIFEPPKRLKGLKHYKAVRHLARANKIREDRGTA